MKRFIAILLLCVPLFVAGQELGVKSFEQNESDLTALNESTKVIDSNNDVCALIKIETKEKGFVFDGGTVGIAKVDESQTGEIWVYVPSELKRITIKHEKFGVLRDYHFPVRLQKARTYIMKLRTPQTMVVMSNANAVVVTPITGTTLTEDNVPKNIAGEYEIPEGVTTIGKMAFRGCRDLTRVIIPASVRKIEDFAFLGCEGLTSIEIPDGVDSIGESVFEYCTGLTAVQFPRQMTFIDGWVFDGCTGLTSVTIPQGVTEIKDGVFYDCVGLNEVVIPESVTAIGKNAFAGCNALQVIYVPKGMLKKIKKLLPKELQKMVCER